MLGEFVETTLHSVPALRRDGLKLSRAMHQAVLDGGKGLRNLVDLLHGVWLGHPLHPLLTDMTIGAWTLSAFFDALSLAGGSRKSQHAADTLVGLGNLSALPTALAGLADFSTIPQGAAHVGFAHGLLNTVGYTCFLGSQVARSRNLRPLAIALSLSGVLILLASAYLGGHLTYRHRVGVNHAQKARGPQQWTPVLAAAELRSGVPVRVELADNAILLYRQNDDAPILATGAVCSHAGGPLEEGHFQGHCVQCPWHDSVFDLHTGAIVHGPATYPLTTYAARIQSGQIELRLPD